MSLVLLYNQVAEAFLTSAVAIGLSGSASASVGVTGDSNRAVGLVGAATASVQVSGASARNLALTGSASATARVNGASVRPIGLTGEAAAGNFTGTVTASSAKAIRLTGSIVALLDVSEARGRPSRGYTGTGTIGTRLVTTGATPFVVAHSGAAGTVVVRGGAAGVETRERPATTGPTLPE